MGNIESSQIMATMWDNFDARVKAICKFYGITKIEMAAKIGSTQSNLSILNNGKQHHTDAYRIMLGYPDINARWLLFGEGEMIETKPESEPDSETTKVSEPSAPYGTIPTHTDESKLLEEYKELYRQKDNECRSLLLELGALRHSIAGIKSLSQKESLVG